MDEKDPILAEVRDTKTKRNLLVDVDPLVVDASQGQPVRFAIEIVNGPEGLIDLEVGSDQEWLQPETKHLSLVGGETGKCVFRALPEGKTKYGNVTFSWPGAKGSTLRRACLVKRITSEKDEGAAGLADVLLSAWTLIPLGIALTLFMLAAVLGGHAGLCIFLGVVFLLGTVGSVATRCLTCFGGR
jgi:hypothetical protein